MKKLNTIMAVALAATFAGNAIAAQQVIGLPDGYTYSNGKVSTEVKAGQDAIASMNAIVDSFATDGGTTLLQPNFWAAFIGDPNSPETFFDYAAAAPAIEELIYTVEGKTFREEVTGEIEGTLVGQSGTGTTVISFTQTEKGGDWTSEGGTYVIEDRFVTTNTAGNFSFGDVDVEFSAVGYYEADVSAGDLDWSQVDSLVSTGKVQLGDLDQKGLSSRSILTTLGILDGVQTPELTGGTSVAPDYSGMYVTRTDEQIQTATLQNSGSLITDAAAASVNIDAYANAVNLLRNIAAANVEENVLDVDKATRALAGLIEHHTDFLTSSIIAEAMKLKQIMQNNAYLTAASILGHSSFSQCADQLETGVIDSSCTAHGAGFATIEERIGTNAGSIVANNDALVALSAFVTNLVDFDDVSNAYDASASADDIGLAYSTIAVDEGIAQGSISSWSDASAVDFDGFDATFELTTISDLGVELVESALFN